MIYMEPLLLIPAIMFCTTITTLCNILIKYRFISISMAWLPIAIITKALLAAMKPKQSTNSFLNHRVIDITIAYTLNNRSCCPKAYKNETIEHTIMHCGELYQQPNIKDECMLSHHLIIICFT